MARTIPGTEPTLADLQKQIRNLQASLVIALPLAVFAAWMTFIGMLGTDRGRFSQVSVSDSDAASGLVAPRTLSIGDAKTQASLFALDEALLNLQYGQRSATLEAGAFGPSLWLRSDDATYRIHVDNGKLMVFGSNANGKELNSRVLMDLAKEYPD